MLFRRRKTHSWLRQPFDKPMILFDEIVEVFNLSQFHLFRQDASSFGIGCIIRGKKRVLW